MFTIHGKYGNITNAIATAHESECSVLPVLEITYCNVDGHTQQFIVQRSNTDLPGYYVKWHSLDHEGRLLNDSIYTGYLPNELGGCYLPALPDTVLKSLIRSYVYVALANLFSARHWEFYTHTYDNRHLAMELDAAIEKFIELEFAQIKGE